MAAVSADIEFRLVTGVGTGPVVPALLTYDTANPYAVTATFCTHDGDVCWEVGRDLLAAGLHHPTGVGDVRARPARRSLRAVIELTLHSPSGSAALEADRGAVQAFLETTDRLVPIGSEPGLIDLDAELELLLTGGFNQR